VAEENGKRPAIILSNGMTVENNPELMRAQFKTRHQLKAFSHMDANGDEYDRAIAACYGLTYEQVDGLDIEDWALLTKSVADYITERFSPNSK
jgi:hypothetical protein